jgi:hypothetical protein
MSVCRNMTTRNQPEPTNEPMVRLFIANNTWRAGAVQEQMRKKGDRETM